MEKLILGESFENFSRVQSEEEAYNELVQVFLSSSPLRDIGLTADDTLYFAEEDRESHIHVLGATGEGKSKFLELLLRQDIDNGYGATLLDPSDNGDTMYKVLRYAVSKGYPPEKIIIIDPNDALAGPESQIPLISALPIIRDKEGKPQRLYAPRVVGDLMNTIRVLWGQGDFTSTPRIGHFLPALLRTLYAADLTMAEVRYFLAYKFYAQRELILSHLHAQDDDRSLIEDVFATKTSFEKLESTVNRLDVFKDRLLSLMFGSSDPGIDFRQVVSGKYLVLVSLYGERVWGQGVTPHQKLLGSIVLMNLFQAVSSLRANGWRGRHYIYIDEVGDYANANLTFVLDKKRKSGLGLTLAHTRFSHLDKDVESSVNINCKIKALFAAPSREDRDKMLRMMYSGAITENDVTHAASALKRGHAIIKVDKMPPRMTQIQHIPDIEIPIEQLAAYKAKIYNIHPFYRKPRTVEEEINKRFAVTQNTKFTRGDNLVAKKTSSASVAGSRKGNDRQPGRQTRSTGRQGQPSTVPDDSGSSAAERPDPGVQVRPDVRPDFTDVETTRKRRSGSPQQGDKPQGG